MNRVYFPGLNTIRLYAALCVVLGHVIDYTPGYTFSAPIFHWLSFILLSGYEAVSLFFVLSGFLITYLLLDEKCHSGTIRVGRFYGKRARRIQPLYILVTLLTLAVSGLEQPTTAGLIGILLLSPHLTFAGLGALQHLWSIGVEEWFYFALPPLLRRLNVLLLAGGVIGVRLLLALAVTDLMEGNAYTGGWLTVLHFLRFECMAIGALGAWLLFNRHWLLRWVYRLELPTLVLLGLIVFLRFPGGFAYNVISSLAFIVFILNVATKQNERLNLERPLLAQLGKVTYGVYMYHPLVTYFVSRTLIGLPAGILTDVALYTGVALGSLLVASLSYAYFERMFTAYAQDAWRSLPRNVSIERLLQRHFPRQGSFD